MKTTVDHPALNTKIESQPAIYVGTYAKYNNGSIAGAWVDMTQIAERDDFNDLCRALHADENDPEIMFQDWQCIPAEMIGESWLSDDWFAYWADLSNLDGYEHEAYAAYVKGSGNKSVEDFRDAYAGRYDSDEDFAEAIADECGMIPAGLSWPLNCIDWERAARELMYDYFEQDGYYFRS